MNSNVATTLGRLTLMSSMPQYVNAVLRLIGLTPTGLDNWQQLSKRSSKRRGGTDLTHQAAGVLLDLDSTRLPILATKDVSVSEREIERMAIPSRLHDFSQFTDKHWTSCF